MKFEVSKRARRHIETIQAWWAENRPDAPHLFLDELASAERALRANPLLGVVYEPRTSAFVRRVTKRHLYYRYREDRDELVVVAVWVLPVSVGQSCRSPGVGILDADFLPFRSASTRSCRTSPRSPPTTPRRRSGFVASSELRSPS